MNWPNRVTIARIMLLPLLVILAVQAEEGVVYRYATLALFAVLAATDAVDGILARMLGQKTELGAFLDPLADKLLLTTTCVLLALPLWLDPGSPQPRSLIPKWIAILVISRDLFLAVGGLIVFILTDRLVVRARWLGKITTNIQVLMLVAALLPQCPPDLLQAAIWTAAGFTVASWLQYTVDGSRQFAHGGAPKPAPVPQPERKEEFPRL